MEAPVKELLNMMRNHPLLVCLVFFAFGAILSYFALDAWSVWKKKEEEGLSFKDEEGYIAADLGGAVLNPGIYQLPKGSRLADLLRLGGGVSNDVSKKWISRNMNLSKELKDADKLYVPFEWEVRDEEPIESIVAMDDLAVPVSTESTGSAIMSCQGTDCNNMTINVNTATQEELMSLPGIGETYAKRIIDSRPVKDTNDMKERIKVPESTITKISGMISF